MYRLTQGKHTRFVDGKAVKLQAGDVFEPSKAELAAFGDRLEKVQEPVPPFIEEETPQIDAEPEPGEIAVPEPVTAQEPEISEPDDAAATNLGMDQEPVILKPVDLEKIPNVSDLPGISAAVAKDLEKNGIVTLWDLARVAGGPELDEMPGIGKAKAAKIRQAVMAYKPETASEE
jgi:predicted RecB family nuclease